MSYFHATPWVHHGPDQEIRAEWESYLRFACTYCGAGVSEFCTNRTNGQSFDGPGHHPRIVAALREHA
jgi:hypothetical protein